ncbi:MAG: type II toxin-antitoxin system VapC family toxin [Anaerolineales bacterium]|nr:type II toxin-antitoxin system VapC family toxin [Anaerolineales bacterium]
MILPDVNVLVYAHREDSPQHIAFRNWLEKTINSSQAYGISDLVLSGFIRVVTHPRVFSPPSPLDQAFQFVDQIRSQPNCVLIEPGPRHWMIYKNLCKEVNAKGNLVPDAYFAAMAIESGSEWITTDRDFSRFPGLRWRHPLS